MAEQLPGVERAIETRHAEVLAAVDAAATDAARGWPPAGAPDGSVVRTDFGAALRERGLYPELVGVLTTAVDAAGGRLAATPVPAPPYVIVTSRGVVLRATMPDWRLVVELVVFALSDDRYTRLDGVDVGVERR